VAPLLAGSLAAPADHDLAEGLMMKTIRVEEIPADLRAREFLESLDVSQGEVVFEQGGQARLVVMSTGLLELRRRAKAELFLMIKGLRSRNPSTDADDVLSDLEEWDRAEQSCP
jgi:hypothetical protein